MHIAVAACAARRGGLAGVGEVDVLEAGLAGLVAGLGADGEDGVVVPVYDDVVRAADGEVGEEADEVGFGVEGLGGGRVHG